MSKEVQKPRATMLFPMGKSRMAKRFRETDWSHTALGAMDSWPDILRLSIENALNISFPVGIAWGKELIHLYNDAYAELLAQKHPHVLGRPTKEVWPEVWEEVKLMIDQVMETKAPLVYENARFVLLRDGGPRESFFTFCYSPIFAGTEEVSGFQVTATETTAHVQGQRRLEATRALAETLLKCETPDEVFTRSLQKLEQFHEDISFALLYFQEEQNPGVASFYGSVGLQKEPFSRALSLHAHQREAEELQPGTLFLGPEGKKKQVVVMPLRIGSAGNPTVLGYLVLGLPEVLQMNRDYLSFLEELSDTIIRTYSNLKARQTSLHLAESRRSNELLRERAQLLESIDDPLYSMDRNFRITYVNEAARHDPSWPCDDVRGQRVADVFPTLDKVFLDSFERALSTGESQVSEAFHGPRYYEARVFPWDQGLSVVFRDITKERAYQDRLVEARNRAEEMTRLKSALLANMSHEVRTPLTSIIGMSTVLSRQVPDELKRQALLIEKAGKRLAATLDSVLTLAQLEGSPKKRDLPTIDLVTEANEAIHALRHLADDAEVDLRMRAPLQLEARADKAYLTSIFNNLLGNAIKFTPSGGEVCLVLQEDEKGALLQVTDTGIGISADFLPHLFDEFRQASVGLSRSHGGVGLGLSIVRRMVWAMSAKITVFSTPGGGTTFTILFPRESDH